MSSFLFFFIGVIIPVDKLHFHQVLGVYKFWGIFECVAGGKIFAERRSKKEDLQKPSGPRSPGLLQDRTSSSPKMKLDCACLLLLLL